MLSPLRFPPQNFGSARACANCMQRLNDDQRKRCGGCESVSYCSRECQRAHWHIHRDNCAPNDYAWADVPDHDKPLVSAARKFLNRHLHPLTHMTSKLFQQHIVELPGNRGSSDTAFFDTWKETSRAFGLLVRLQEKPDTTRQNPSSGDVFYVPLSAQLVPLDLVPGNQSKRLSLINKNERADGFVGAFVVAADILAKDGTPCRIITATMSVGSVHLFRRFRVANDAEGELAATRQQRMRSAFSTPTGSTADLSSA
ncbi:hypothetical protein VNI00_006434 [Paramarasmius palmivorus]|uniref:MYND-type domain-containing protein n=1 Tax=Paramarasmius palmivorus TaxID=297713 RepID=A0AAW0D9S3_9AGAR